MPGGAGVPGAAGAAPVEAAAARRTAVPAPAPAAAARRRAVAATAPRSHTAAGLGHVRVAISDRSRASILARGVTRVRLSGAEPRRADVRFRVRIRALSGAAGARRPWRAAARSGSARLDRHGVARTALRLTASGRRALRSCASVELALDARLRSRLRSRRQGSSTVVVAARRLLPPDPSRCPAPAATSPPSGTGGPYLVGVAARSINPEPDGRWQGQPVNLGGYGIGGPPLLHGRAATGILGDGLHVRAIVIGDGHHLVAIADEETQGWFVADRDGPVGLRDMRLRIAQASGGALSASDIVIQSDHTHGGPDPIGAWGGVPLSYRRYIADQTVAAILDAYHSMRRGTLWYGTAPGRDLLANQFDYDPANQSVDSDVRVLQARDPQGRPFATLLNFSAHATVLGPDNTKVTGDWPQAANRLLAERFGGQALTIVGTLGRTQPADRGCSRPGTPPGDATHLCALDAYAGRVVDRAALAAAAAQPLGGPALVAARSYLIQDVGTGPLVLGLAYAGFAVGGQLDRSLSPPWTTANILGSVTGSVRIGDVLLSVIPGEAYPQIPLEVRALVPARGYMTAGLADDQLGYLIAPYGALAEPIRRTLFNQRGDQISPASNDNYTFNVSPTIGERVLCSLLRGAGEVFGLGGAPREAEPNCLLFFNDAGAPAGADVG